MKLSEDAVLQSLWRSQGLPGWQTAHLENQNEKENHRKMRETIGSEEIFLSCPVESKRLTKGRPCQQSFTYGEARRAANENSPDQEQIADL